MNIQYFLLLLLNIMLLVSGQILWKIGLSKTALELNLLSIIKTVFNPYIFAGLLIYLIATVVWFFILKNVNLSVAYPMQSICYIISAFAAYFLFKEVIPPTRWIGLVIISIGIYFVSR